MLKDGLPLAHWRELSEGRQEIFSLPPNTFPKNCLYKPESANMPGADGLLTHVLAPVDAFWWHKNNVDWLKDEPESRYIRPQALAPGEMEPPMYSAAELARLQNAFLSVGGAVTLNVGVFMDGTFGEKTLEILKYLKTKRTGKDEK